MAEYYMILTVAGQAAYARAGAGGSPVQISAVAVGDGGGVAVQPAESWTALVGEVWRGAPTLVAVDEANPRLVLVEAHVPHNSGGWYAREIGLLSPEGVLLAVGNYPESYKPVLDSGVGKELLIRAYIEHGNASQTTLKINPDIVMASRTYVVSAVATHDASPTAHAGQLAGMSEHIDDLANPHQVTAAQVGAEAAGTVNAHDQSAAAHPDIRAAIAGIVIPNATEDVAGILTLGQISGTVRAYTRQQYAAPVLRTGASGSQAVNCDLHQTLAITANGALAFDAPTGMATGKSVTLSIDAAIAQTIAWDAAWKGSSSHVLPTSTLGAGKHLLLSFWCLGSAMLLVGVVEEV